MYGVGRAAAVAAAAVVAAAVAAAGKSISMASLSLGIRWLVRGARHAAGDAPTAPPGVVADACNSVSTPAAPAPWVVPSANLLARPWRRAAYTPVLIIDDQKPGSSVASNAASPVNAVCAPPTGPSDDVTAVGPSCSRVLPSANLLARPWRRAAYTPVLIIDDQKPGSSVASNAASPVNAVCAPPTGPSDDVTAVGPSCSHHTFHCR